MECQRCTRLPQTEFGEVRVCLTVPTTHHIEPITRYLESAAVTHVFREDTFSFVSRDFNQLIRDLDQMGLSSLEKGDLRLLPHPDREPLSFHHLNRYRSLQYWSDLLHAGQFLEILDQSRIQVLFQPIVEAATGALFGYEGLSRGVLPNGAFMMPNELFAHARKTDMMFFLDRICRECVIAAAACQHITEKVFINFIPTSIYDPEKCLQSTDEALRKHGLKPEQIVFEVVETEYIEDFAHLNRILNYYRAKGYSTALDDMGSGYSTSDSLLSLHPNYLKVDMDIVRGIDRDSGKQRRFEAFMMLGEQHGIRTLAEGVETEAELAYVRSAGVDLVQGYYFGKPQAEVGQMGNQVSPI